MTTALIYGMSLIVCVGLLCFKGITINHKYVSDVSDVAALKTLQEAFEKANDTDTEKDPTYTDVMKFINEEFGGNDYGFEPTEQIEE